MCGQPVSHPENAGTHVRCQSDRITQRRWGLLAHVLACCRSPAIRGLIVRWRAASPPPGPDMAHNDSYQAARCPRSLPESLHMLPGADTGRAWRGEHRQAYPRWQTGGMRLSTARQETKADAGEVGALWLEWREAMLEWAKQPRPRTPATHPPRCPFLARSLLTAARKHRVFERRTADEPRTQPLHAVPSSS